MFDIKILENKRIKIITDTGKVSTELNTHNWSFDLYTKQWGKSLDNILNGKEKDILITSYSGYAVIGFILYSVDNKIYIRENLFNSEICGDAFYLKNWEEIYSFIPKYEKNRLLTKEEVENLKKDGVIWGEGVIPKRFSEWSVNLNSLSVFVRNTKIF